MRVCLALAVAVLLGRAMHGQAAAEAPPFFDVRPGLSTRAEVDLRLGEPVEKLPPAHGYPRFRYAPPRGRPTPCASSSGRAS